MSWTVMMWLWTRQPVHNCQQLEQTEASGGSLTSDGGILCLETNSNNLIMIASDKSKICDKRKYCQNSLDVEQRHKNCEKGSSEEQENSSTEEQPLTPKDTPQRPTQFTTKPTSGKPYKPLDNEPGIKIKEEKNKVFPIQTTPLSIDSGIPTIHNTFIFWHWRFDNTRIWQNNSSCTLSIVLILENRQEAQGSVVVAVIITGILTLTLSFAIMGLIVLVKR